MRHHGQGIALLVAIAAVMGILGSAPAVQGATLSWTSPGDDVMIGVATLYDLRYSINVPITEENFQQCPVIPGVPLPQTPGSPQTLYFRGMLRKGVYYFAMKTADDSGNWSSISNIGVLASSPALPDHSAQHVEGEVIVLGFSSPTPNPAGAPMRFDLSLPEAAPVRVEAFDLNGRRVRTLLQGTREAGRADLMWDLRDDQGLPIRAGVYLVRAMLPGKVVTHRAVVIR